MRCVSIVCISLRTIAVPLVTASSTILFISFFSSLLDGAFSIASMVFAKVVLASLKASLMSSSTEGLDMSSKLFG